MSHRPIRLFNTITKSIETVTPLAADTIRIYSCGPTVYDFAHIGNFRSYVFADTLVRLLKYLDYDVTWVMNITDIDDKTIAGAHKEHLPLSEFTARYENAFFADLTKLNVTQADGYPRATEHLQEMREIIELLLQKRLAYQAEDGVYFDISEFREYGTMAGLDIMSMKEGARVAVDLYDKDDLRDFALWKFDDKTPVSLSDNGRPGWHIECSAMSRKYLGQPFDIHTGGVDLIFPHHTNEIAQSVGAYGYPLAEMFVHNEHLLVDGKKMSKSLKNFYTLRDIIAKGYDPMTLKYLYLRSHYREKMNFTFKALDGAQQTLEKIRGLVKRYLISHQSTVYGLQPTARSQIIKALANDLNTPSALSILHEANDPAVWLEFDQVLGLRLTEIQADITLTDQQRKLIKKREQLRNQKHFGEADKIRQELEKQGITVEDTTEGPRVLK